jgi:hypothetical protein
MSTIPQVANAMQEVLTTNADRLGRESGFVRRVRKLDGSSFIQALVFGFQAKPDAGYEELSQSAAIVGVPITPQGLEQRFTRTAAEFVQKVLKSAVEKVIASRAAAVPILQRFEGVYLRDSTVIKLPDELVETWPGVGDSQGQTAALKLQVELDFSTGRLAGPVLQSGRTNDQTSPFQHRQLPAGALHLADLGYFSLERLSDDQRKGVHWITRLKTDTAIYTLAGERLDLVAWLDAQGETEVDQEVLIGARERLPCRLLAVRVPQEVAEQRRRRLRNYARKKQVTPKAKTLALTAWTLVITNVPEKKLSLKEALILLRVRWQVELLFKLWKSYARVDTWRSRKPWRILCEVYAKLIGAIILHWILLTAVWQRANRSLFKAARAVQKYAVTLLLGLRHPVDLTRILTSMLHCLMATCRVNRRAKQPSTYQLLLDLP